MLCGEPIRHFVEMGHWWVYLCRCDTHIHYYFKKIYKTCAFNNQNQLNLIYLYSISNVFFIYILLSHRTDKFQIRSGNMGDLLRISLRNDDTGESADWHLDKILIVDSSGKEYRFPANVWLSHDPGRQLDIMLTKGMFLLYQLVRSVQSK